MELVCVFSLKVIVYFQLPQDRMLSELGCSVPDLSLPAHQGQY